MKRIAGLALFAVIGFYLWKNHFARLFQPKDQITESLEEVRIKNQIGDSKRAAWLAARCRQLLSRYRLGRQLCLRLLFRDRRWLSTAMERLSPC